MKLKMPEKPNISRRTATAIIIAVTSAVLLGFIIFGIINLGHVGSIRVEGESHYSDELIIELSGIKVGDKVSSLDLRKIEENIVLGAPRIKSAKIDPGLVGDLAIRVEPEVPRYYMALATGEYFLVSDGFRIIDMSPDPEEYEKMGVIRLTLPEVSSAMVGDYIEYKGKTEEEREANRDRARSFIAKIEELCGDYVTAVGFEDIYTGVYVVLEGKYKIELGNMNDTERKIEAALETIKAHGEEKGCAVVNAANYSEIYYKSVENIEY